MKTLLSKVDYYKNSAYVYVQDVEAYASREGKNFDDAFNDLEQEIPEFDFVEEEKDGRLIFHKSILETNDYFVYQNWIDETLFASNLTFEDAIRKQGELDSLIEAGYCGSGCACIGRVSDPGDYWTAKRLNLL